MHGRHSTSLVATRQAQIPSNSWREQEDLSFGQEGLAFQAPAGAVDSEKVPEGLGSWIA